MTILPENLSYSDRDKDSIVARLDNMIDTVFPTWTDKSSTNAGNTLKELFAWVGDILSFYLDNASRESRLTDVQLRANALKIAAMLGFSPPGATAAQAEVVLSLGLVPGADVNFSAGTVVTTASSGTAIRFQTVGDLTIPLGTDPPQAVVIVENSVSHEETFVSTGLGSQKITLASSPYLDQSAVVVAINGPYLQVDSLLDSGRLDLSYSVSVDDDGRATLLFPNGSNGIPPIGDTTIFYNTGGGEAGNVDAHTITVISGSFQDDLGNSVAVTVDNPERAQGGEPRMSKAEIQRQAPRSQRVVTRTVSLDDYEIGAELVPGVLRALMVTADQLPGIPENTGRLYIVPIDGTTPSEVLKSAVLHAVTVEKPNTITFRTTVHDAVYKVLDISYTIYVSAGFTPSSVASTIRGRLGDLFRLKNENGTPNERLNFGGTNGSAEFGLLGSVVGDVLANTPGLSKIGPRDQDLLINGSHEDVPFLPYEFPKLGTVIIVDAVTGNQV